MSNDAMVERIPGVIGFPFFVRSFAFRELQTQLFRETLKDGRAPSLGRRFPHSKMGLSFNQL